MASLGTVSHDQFPSDVCLAHGWAGENVGVAYGDPVQAVLAMHAMMMAEGPCPHRGCPGNEMETYGHYANILNAHFKYLGIGLVWVGNAVWLTENFTD